MPCVLTGDWPVASASGGPFRRRLTVALPAAPSAAPRIAPLATRAASCAVDRAALPAVPALVVFIVKYALI